VLAVSVIEDKKDRSSSEVIKQRENEVVKLVWNSAKRDVWQFKPF
jgi:hypothetical protein